MQNEAVDTRSYATDGENAADHTGAGSIDEEAADTTRHALDGKAAATQACTGNMQNEAVDTRSYATDGENAADHTGAGSIDEWLGDLAVEIVFPACAFIKLWVLNAGTNEHTIRRGLVEGASLREKRAVPWQLVAGSRAEGVAMEERWGHPEPDEDLMMLRGAGLAVGVSGPGELPPEGFNLVYREEGCPPAYTRLEVTHEDSLLEAIRRAPGCSKAMSASVCVSEKEGRQWLLSRPLLIIMMHPDRTVQGPAAATGLRENVTGLVCSGPHLDMTAYIERPRKDWPSKAQLEDLLALPMLLVCIGPKDHPDTDHLFRVSWSPHEMRLFTDLVLWAKQGYICFKHVLKALLTSSRPQGGNDGRSRVGSYHLKTVFFRYLEEHPPQPEGSPFHLVLALCQNLQQCLVKKELLHYFLPGCNLLEKVEEAEREEALGAITKVLLDPLVAIINSPSQPEEIFGSQRSSNDILRCFQAVSEQPTCEDTRVTLQCLLRDLDKHRQQRYREQRERDRKLVSGRPGLVRLIDHLKRNAPADSHCSIQ